MKLKEKQLQNSIGCGKFISKLIEQNKSKSVDYFLNYK